MKITSFFKRIRTYLYIRVHQVNRHEYSLVIIGHESSKTGASLLLLSFIKELFSRGEKPIVILRNGGALLPDYLATSWVFYPITSKSLFRFLKKAKKHGCYSALLNTTVNGDLCPFLKDEGFNCVTLVHELPGVITQLGLMDRAKSLASCSSSVVFPSSFVRDRFCDIVGHITSAISIIPQGIYSKPSTTKDKNVVRKALFPNLGNSQKIILNVGTCEKRKGFDFFVQMACESWKKQLPYVFVWIGQIDQFYLNEIIPNHKNPLPSNLIFPGYIPKQDVLFDYFLCADFFALTSREEPFGTVVLNSLSVGVPVIAFKGCGGFVDVIKNRETGFLVEKGDIQTMLSTISSALADEKTYFIMKQNCLMASKQYDFPKYVCSVMSLFQKKV